MLGLTQLHAVPCLLSWRHLHQSQGINDKRLRAYIALQAAYGMEYLHLHYMVHFDLKCELRAGATATRVCVVVSCRTRTTHRLTDNDGPTRC